MHCKSIIGSQDKSSYLNESQICIFRTNDNDFFDINNTSAVCMNSLKSGVSGITARVLILNTQEKLLAVQNDLAENGNVK